MHYTVYQLYFIKRSDRLMARPRTWTHKSFSPTKCGPGHLWDQLAMNTTHFDNEQCARRVPTCSAVNVVLLFSSHGRVGRFSCVIFCMIILRQNYREKFRRHQ